MVATPDAVDSVKANLDDVAGSEPFCTRDHSRRPVEGKVLQLRLIGGDGGD